MPEDQHARPRGRSEELLYDPDVPTLTHGERARTLVAAHRTGALSTIAREPEGYPYGSFITFALQGANPVFLISALAEHSKNLALEPRCSLLVAESHQDDPLANGRVTLVGQCSKVSADEREACKEAYLAVLPNAAYYVDFKDFSFWRLRVEAVRYIGGYGRMSWVTDTDWAASAPDPIAEHADGIIEHMNADHAETMAAYCKAFSKAKDASEVTMTSVDRYGFEMSVVTDQGPRPVRLAFSEVIQTPLDARREMVALAKRARSQA